MSFLAELFAPEPPGRWTIVYLVIMTLVGIGLLAVALSSGATS